MEYVFTVDHDLVSLQEGRNPEFHSEFREAVQYYRKGDWPLAF